jgi:alpha-mannosidase
MNVPGGKATYESPYGTVLLDKDEMPGTFRGHGERWVQKWIDISNRNYGLTMATRQISHAINNKGIEPLLVRTAVDCGTCFYHYDQDDKYQMTYSLVPHKGDWKKAASYRAGWEFNSPLYPCVMNACFPIKPVRLSRNLPERGGFLKLNNKNIVITAIDKSLNDPDTFIIRLVEYYGRTGDVKIVSGLDIENAEEVNFLEKKIRKLSSTRNQIKLKVKGNGIHTIKVRFK